MNINSFLLTDFYKVGHVFQYPPGTERVYSNLTPRKSRIFGVDHMVFFGLQYFLQEYLVEHFNRNFFYRSLESVMVEYRNRVESSLGGPLPSYEHVEAIHRMGFLPIEIKALPEGTLVPMRVPCITIANTVPEHAWLTNWVESLLSTSIWQPCTSATIAHEYRKLLDKYAAETGMDPGFVQWQGHDFSLRGMSSLESAVTSGMGHLLSFTGTDTIPAISALKKYYSGDGLIGGSVAATEHSVMCAGEQDSELETFRRLIEDVYPSGIVSIVSDTWDLWKVLNEYMPALRSKIMARNGKVVIRPDSGDPVNIICGDDESSNRLERMGVVELLWQHFGGTRTSTGHKLLDSHVGAIYGDSITLERAKQICEGLKRKGFASQVVFGIGSYCVTPETKILCDDFTWREAGTLMEGQGILAFDENPSYGTGKNPSRRYVHGRITANRPGVKDCVKIKCGDREISCSKDHPFLVAGSLQSRQDFYHSKPSLDEIKRLKMPRGSGFIWKAAEDLKPGDKLAFFGDEWNLESTREAGWIAGIFDGEGCIYTGKSGRSIAAWKISISQNRGVVNDAIAASLKARGFTFYTCNRKCMHTTLTGGFYQTARFLGSIRPHRLISKALSNMHDLPAMKRGSTFRTVEVTSVNPIGIQAVSSITTSVGTFITGGFLTHNTYQYNTRDTFGTAMKATSVTINGQRRSISKNPMTDDGTKKSAAGLLYVGERDGELYLEEDVTPEREKEGLLKTVFRNGLMTEWQTLHGIRERLEKARARR